MSNITDRNVIDCMMIENRTIVLIILDTLPWEYVTRSTHSQAMLGKVNDYLDFVHSGQIYEHRNKDDFDCVSIRLVAQYSFSRYALNLFEKIRLQIHENGDCSFEWCHSEEDLRTKTFDDGFSDDFIFNAEKVYPRIKKNWAKKPLEEVSLLNYKAPDGKVNAPMYRIWESYVGLFMQDVGEGYVYLDYDMLPENIDIDKLNEKAFENLSRDIDYRMEESKEKGIFGLLAGGDFEVESLCFGGIWEQCANTLNGNLAIAIPTRDMVLFTLADNKKLTKKLLRMAREILERNRTENPKLIFSNDVFEFNRDTKELKLSRKLKV